MRRAVVVGVTLALLSGCSQQVTVRSKPAGAVVRINQVPAGKTPVQFTDWNGFAKTYEIEVSAPGYETTRRTIRQEWNLLCVAASVVGGFFCLLPFAGLAACTSLPQSHYDFFLDPKGDRGRVAPERSREPAVEPSPEDEGPIIPL